MSILKKLLGSGPPSEASYVPKFTVPLSPDEPFYAIGDIHGSFDELDRLLIQIEAREESTTVVCVGDYVDRGERSASVLLWLKRLNDVFQDRFVCLKGNHEEMMLAFIDDPERYGERWVRFGGLQTLASLKIGWQGKSSVFDARDQFVEQLGPEMIAWLRALPNSWQSGNIFVAHAAADPRLPLNAQSKQVLRWGHPDFNKVPREDGNWVVHGHTIVDRPLVKDGRISIDTGAYATGTLTAAYISRDGVEFLTT